MLNCQYIALLLRACEMVFGRLSLKTFNVTV